MMSAVGSVMIVKNVTAFVKTLAGEEFKIENVKGGRPCIAHIIARFLTNDHLV